MANPGFNNPIMGGEPFNGPMFPQGVGVTSREGGTEDCTCCPPVRSCCPICCGQPIFFVNGLKDGDFKSGDMEVIKYKGCFGICACLGWTLENADVQGHRMSFEGNTCSGCCCCEPEIVVYEGGLDGRKVGSAKRHCNYCSCANCPCCGCCCSEVMASAEDAQGNKVWERKQHVDAGCCDNEVYKSREGCCWGCCTCEDRWDWPFENSKGDKAGYIQERSNRCCCTACYGDMLAVDPRGSWQQESNDAKMLLVGMILVKYFRGADAKEQEALGEQAV